MMVLWVGCGIFRNQIKFKDSKFESIWSASVTSQKVEHNAKEVYSDNSTKDFGATSVHQLSMPTSKACWVDGTSH